MPQHQTPLFYFPSMVVFVDDSRNFLDNFSLQLDADLAFQLYDSPIAALTALNAPAEKNSSVEQFFSISRFGDELPLSHHVLDLNLNNIVREAQNPHRFERISVVVVDYDMPEMDGLELCRNIKNHSIKKILLTGKADEKLAVQAFNQGLIDRFIMKQDAEVIPSLNQAIVELQQAYFENMARSMKEALSLGSHSFLRDGRFAEEFNKICQQAGVVEFYLTAMPEGYLLLDAKGSASLLVIKTEDELQSHFEIAADQGAPAKLLEQLKSHKVIPYFPTPEGEYTPKCKDWWSCLYPATKFKGREPYYYAVVTKPSGLNLAKVLSYQAFLKWHDQQGATKTEVRPQANT